MHPMGRTVGLLFYYSAHLAGIFKQKVCLIPGHERRPEVTRASVNVLRMCLRPRGQARTPLLKFKIEPRGVSRDFK